MTPAPWNLVLFILALIALAVATYRAFTEGNRTVLLLCVAIVLLMIYAL